MTEPRRQVAAIYCRISIKDDKRETSKVSDQEGDCRALCTRAGYDVVQVYVDDGVSAYAFKNRPGWAQMLADAEAERFQVLVAVAEDRLTRQPREKLALAALCAEHGITWHTVRDGLVDPASDEGELFAYFRSWTGRKESKAHSARRKTANAHRRATGEPSKAGVRPFGYNADRKTLHPEESALIRKATDHLLAGGNMYSVVQMFRDSGLDPTFNKKTINPNKADEHVVTGRGWGHAGVRSVLIRGRNAGIVEHQGEEVVGVTGQWEPIMTREELMALRNALTTTPGKRVGRPKSLLGGIARCAVCSGKLIGATGSSHGKQVPYYICETKKRTRNDDEIDGRRHASITIRILDARVIDKLIAIYLESPADPAASARATETKTLAGLYARRRKAADARAEYIAGIKDRQWTRGEVVKLLADLDVELNEIEREIALVTERSAHAAMLAETWNELARGEPIVGRVTYAGDIKHDVEFSGLVRHAEQDMGMSHEEAVGSVQLFLRYMGLDLEQRRNLIKSLFKITVSPGKGSERVKIARIQEEK